jgi:hypothetical protein
MQTTSAHATKGITEYFTWPIRSLAERRHTLATRQPPDEYAVGKDLGGRGNGALNERIHI